MHGLSFELRMNYFTMTFFYIGYFIINNSFKFTFIEILSLFKTSEYTII